jgi:hypothetical protein
MKNIMTLATIFLLSAAAISGIVFFVIKKKRRMPVKTDTEII